MSASYLDRRMIPSLIRFVMEISTWIWLFFFNLVILILDVLALALLNVPGDKKAVDVGVVGLHVTGPIRVGIELITAVLGIAAAFSVGNTFTGILQLFLVALYLVTDRKRLLWMMNRGPRPDYVSFLHKLDRKKNDA